jgi:hypothetical protein
MQLELSDDELEALRQVLQESLRDLSSEIADTDNAMYRKGLSSYRETLRSIQSRL